MADAGDPRFADTWSRTCSNTIKFNHKWTIENYSLHSQKSSDEYLESPAFSPIGNDKTKWCLKLYPSDNTTEEKEFIGLYVCLLASNAPKVEAEAKLHFVDANNSKRHSQPAELLDYVLNEPLGHPDFIEKSVLLKEANILLPNDKLTIFCEIVIHEKIVEISGKHEPIHLETSKSHITDDFLLLFQTRDFSDVTLTVDGKDILAHKMILVARSPVFSTMFKNDMKETKLSRVTINDVDYEVFMGMLHFFYTDKVPKLEKMAAKLLAAADRYAVEGLKAVCARTLHKSLNIENAVDILILADLHNVEQLKIVATDFICIYEKDIIATGAFELLVHAFPDLMVEILRARRMRNNGLESCTAGVKSSRPSEWNRYISYTTY